MNLSKKKIRKKMIHLRKSKYVLDEMTPWKAATNFFLKYRKNYKNIAAYWPMTYELDTRPLIKILLENDINILLPVITKGDLNFVKWDIGNKLKYNKLKFYEPYNCSYFSDPELIIVPLLAFDNFGFRLGYGGGYYDRTFSFLKNNKRKFISVGYAFDGQKVTEVPKDKFDIKLDYVITEKKIYSFI